MTCLPEALYNDWVIGVSCSKSLLTAYTTSGTRTKEHNVYQGIQKRVSGCCALFRLPLKYEHVGSPIWMYREGRDLPGNYTGYAIDRPDLYTGRVSHVEHVLDLHRC